jgi:hypothetical protein
MIKLKNYTPAIYYKDSRDFQLLGRLFDVVLNSVKTEADILYNIPLSDNSNDKLLDLMALTLGFKANKQYSSKQLRAICSVFPEIIKNKGSIKALQIACNALFNANGSAHTLDYNFTDNNSKTELNIYIPQEFGDISIISNLLSYVLPAGMTCNVIRELRYKAASMTEIDIDTTFKLYDQGDVPATYNSKQIFYYDNTATKIPQLSSETTDRLTGVLNVSDAASGESKDFPGIISSSGVYKARVTTDVEEEN